MPKETETDDCIAVIGSVTRAMRAQNVLREAGIRCAVVKAESFRGDRGCTYGVSYPCPWESRIRMLLQNAGIATRSFERRERL